MQGHCQEFILEGKNKDRWKVLLETGDTKTLKEENLEVYKAESEAEKEKTQEAKEEEKAIEVGTHVVVKGLVNGAQFNGMQGHCQEFILEGKNKDRWKVLLETGDTKNLKEENLEVYKAEAEDGKSEAASGMKCQITETPCSNGMAVCIGDCKKCNECNMWFCAYHTGVNMDDGPLSFGGHTCPARRKATGL
jgi:hypothetical protein